MKVKNVKMYSLSHGKYVVSFLDPIKNKRVQKNFDDEVKANTYLNILRAPSEKKHELRYLKTASTDTAVRVYLEQSPKSSLGQSKKLVREFVEFFPSHGVPRLNEQCLSSFFTHLKQEVGLADRSLLVARSKLQGFFKFLILHGALKHSPLDGLKFNRGAPYTRKPKIFENKEIKEFIITAKKYSPALFYPVLLLVRETAAKTSDVLNLRWSDINFKTGKITLNRSNEVQPRTFDISEELLASFRNIECVADHVFTNLENQPLKIYIIGRELKKYQRKVGYRTDWGLIDLRASYGVNFLKAGGTIRDLQKIMGHIRPYQTIEIFSRHAELKSILKGPAAVRGSGVVSESHIEF